MDNNSLWFYVQWKKDLCNFACSFSPGEAAGSLCLHLLSTQGLCLDYFAKAATGLHKLRDYAMKRREDLVQRVPFVLDVFSEFEKSALEIVREMRKGGNSFPDISILHFDGLQLQSQQCFLLRQLMCKHCLGVRSQYVTVETGVCHVWWWMVDFILSLVR